jgi:hypothetical protein
MSSARRQGLIAAPLPEVWSLVADPGRFVEWAGEVVEVTGAATVAEGTTFRQKSRTPLGIHETTFRVEALHDLREIRLRCLDSGYYSHWLLTEAQGATFAEVEIGMEPAHAGYRAFDLVVGRRWHRRLAAESLAGLERATARPPG